jgi:hypothetical protein
MIHLILLKRNDDSNNNNSKNELTLADIYRPDASRPTIKTFIKESDPED